MPEHVTEEILIVASPDGTERVAEALVRTERDAPEQWKIDANECYRGVMSIFLGLAGVAATFPVVIAHQRAGRTGTIMDLLDSAAYGSWALLVISFIAGWLYFHASAEWVKRAWGRTPQRFRYLTDGKLEELLDAAFLATLLGTACGIFASIVYALFLPASCA